MITPSEQDLHRSRLWIPGSSRSLLSGRQLRAGPRFARPRNDEPSKRFVIAQRRDDLFAEQADRTHQIGFRQVGEIEFAHEGVEHA